ncbi:MAG: AmmeMemoRadiSam system protein A [bacterium]
MPLVGAFIVPHPPLILPEVGRGQEKEIDQTIKAYQEVAARIAIAQPETIILTTPHSTVYADYLHLSPGLRAQGSFREFGAPEVVMTAEYDETLVAAITAMAGSEGIPAGTLGERKPALDHASMVPLYFFRQKLPHFKLVRISLSGLSPLIHYRFGKCIAAAIAASGKRVAFVASGDLSHKLKTDGPYGLAPEGPLFDRAVTDAIASGDFLRLLEFEESFCDAAAECGLRSFLMLAGALDGRAVRPELLSYEGPFGVGYAVAAFTLEGPDDSRHFDRIYEERESERVAARKRHEDAFVTLARNALERYVKTFDRLSRPADLPQEMIEAKAGVFVSLHLDGRLRGCIGTTGPTTACIADEIIRNAINAGQHDPRFEPVREQELDRLVYSVDVLGETEPIVSITELDVKRYGVIVRHKGRSGLLLPNLEGIDTPEQQVDIALQKAGIGVKEPYVMERFEVVRHF